MRTTQINTTENIVRTYERFTSNNASSIIVVLILTIVDKSGGET